MIRCSICVLPNHKKLRYASDTNRYSFEQYISIISKWNVILQKDLIPLCDSFEVKDADFPSEKFVKKRTPLHHKREKWWTSCYSPSEDSINSTASHTTTWNFWLTLKKWTKNVKNLQIWPICILRPLRIFKYYHGIFQFLP